MNFETFLESNGNPGDYWYHAISSAKPLYVSQTAIAKSSIQAAKKFFADPENFDVLKFVEKYTGSGYKSTNKNLRGTGDDRSTTENIVQSFRKFKTKSNFYVYRGFGGKLNLNNLPAVGETKTLTGWTSTSLHPGVADYFSTSKRIVKHENSGLHEFLVRIHIPRGSCAIPVESVSYSPSESEVLLPPNSVVKLLPHKAFRNKVANTQHVVDFELIG